MMKMKSILFVLLGCMLLLTAAVPVFAQEKKKQNPVLAPIEDDPDLPRVLIIGDSISMGYTLDTRAMLKDVANLHRPPTNCGPTTKGLEQIDDWLGEGEWDVIHFNFGLHDLKYMNEKGQLVDVDKGKQQVPIEQYAKNLDEIVQRLKKTGATLIWRNTTPVPEGTKGRFAGDAAKYNAAAARVMDKHGVQIHDLYSFAKEHEKEIQRPKNVHYTQEGSKKLAQQVAQVIKAALTQSQSAGRANLYYYRPMERGQAQTHAYDVAVYGGTPAGVTAAVQAARMNKRVVLISFNGYVGGLTSGGLTATDIGRRSSIGGLALAFYDRVGGITDFDAQKAEATFLAMLQDAGVTVLLHEPLETAVKEGTTLRRITTMTGQAIEAKVFVDATYEGDLLAAAGVSYTVGREPRSQYDESLAGQWQTVSWKGVYQFCGLPISPYRTPGDPTSGLLPEISEEPAGKPGDGDNKVQAYNFRMILSDKPGKVAFPKPAGYDADRYALLARFLNFDDRIKWTLNYTTRPMTDGPVQMRNGDSNNAGSFSSDYVGGSNYWPDGTYEPGSFKTPAPVRRGLPMAFEKLYERREQIFQEHVTYQQGLMYFLANDPRVPAKLQQRVNAFGLDPNSFKDSGHWPHQLYVREGRRMVSSYVMTQANCQSTRTAEDSVGLASYPMDSHFCQRVVVERDGVTTVRNEGGFGHKCPKPYPVSYRSIVPKKNECTNLLVPLCLSASHVAYGSIRMEPVFMILGQSAGTAASLAIDLNLAVQDVPYGKLRERLLADKQKL